MARSQKALLALAVAIAVSCSVMSAAGAADPPAPSPVKDVDPAVLSEVAQYVYGMPGRLSEEYPAAYAGVRFEGRPNDAMVIRIVEGAPGIDELKAEVERVRQYSLEKTGVALTYTYEPAPISRARRIEVHTGLAADLEDTGPLARAGLVGFRPDDRGFTLEAHREGRRSVASEVRSLYPGVAFRVEAVRSAVSPGERVCTATAENPRDESSSSSAPDAPRLRAHLELERRCMTAGSMIEGTVVVENDTGQPVDYRMCAGSPFQAHLAGKHYEQDPGGWLWCMGTLQQLPVGESRWPVRVHSSFSQCSQPESVPLPPRTLPLACVGGAPPSLPSAWYRVIVDAVGPDLPLPHPVKLRVR